MNESSRSLSRPGYDTAERAAKYLRRSPRRNRLESDLLNNLLNEIPLSRKGRVLNALDVPAGTGRMAQILRDNGFLTCEADLSREMLMAGSGNGHQAGSLVVSDLAASLPFTDRSFDLVLCWRFLHHLQSLEHVQAVISEAARVARQCLVVSFFHPISLHNLKRKTRALITGKRGCRYTYRPHEIEQAASRVGLKMVKKTAQRPYLNELWAALFQR